MIKLKLVLLIKPQLVVQIQQINEYYLYDANINVIASIPFKVYEYLQAILECDEIENDRIRGIYKSLDENLKGTLLFDYYRTWLWTYNSKSCLITACSPDKLGTSKK